MPVAASREVYLRHTQVHGEKPAGGGDFMHSRFMSDVQIDTLVGI